MENLTKKSLLIALAIGDGSISKSGKNFYYLEIQHSIKQLEYLKYKAFLIEKILDIKVKISTRYTDKTKKYQSCRFRVYHPYLKFIYRKMYINGKKVLTKSLLNKLNLESFSIIFMDDGSRTILKNNDGFQRAVNIYISLMYDLKSTQLLIEWIKETFDIQFRIGKLKNKSYYRIVTGTKEGRKLQIIMKNLLIPSLSYKLDFQ